MMKGQRRFNWHKFLMISMFVIGVGFFLLFLIPPRSLWRYESPGLDEPERNQTTDMAAKRTSDNSVSVPSAEEVARFIAMLESLDEEHDVADENPKTPDKNPGIPIDEDEELTAETERFSENSGSEHEPVDSTAKETYEQKPKYNLYDCAPPDFEDYVQYDRSLDIDQLPSMWPLRQKRYFLEYIQQYPPGAWIFYHPYNMNIFVFMGHLYE
jgi:hypothetical protein